MYEMKLQPEASTGEVLAGLVERVTYHNPENGFCVVRAKARGHRDTVTVVGHAATIAAGEWITASGEWVNDRTHGQQFKAGFLRTSAPTSADGIEKYLSSGMIRGVGPVYAKKLVRAFGEKVFDIIESSPDRLREIEGIGPVRAASILAAWAEQKIVREIMIFLHSHGVGTARAVRIFKTYGGDAIQVMTETRIVWRAVPLLAQERTHAPQQNPCLLDHLVATRMQRVKAEGFGGLGAAHCAGNALFCKDHGPYRIIEVNVLEGYRGQG